MFTPFFLHWYAGVAPPFVIVLLKVTLWPGQIVVVEAVIAIVGVTAAVTVMVTALDVAVVGLAQGALDVSTQVTTSPLARVILVYVAELVPTLLPFNFH